MTFPLIIAPVLLPFCAGVLLLALRDLPMMMRRGLVVCVALGQILFAMALFDAVSGGDILVYRLGNWPAPWGIVLVADRLAAIMVLITACLSLFALIGASGGADRAGRHFHVLWQMQVFGLTGAFLTGDLFNLFVFFEVLLIASYGLLLHGGGPSRVGAGLHYVVLNLLGSSVFLIAAGLCYGILGTLNFADLASRIDALPLQDIGLARVAGLLLFAVFALKAALLPLYLWLPAAYSSASTPVAALFAIMTKVGAYAILRSHSLLFGSAAGPLSDLYEPWLLPLALATLCVGAIGAAAAKRLGQLTAYLVVASIGTLLTTFAIGDATGLAAGLYYLTHSTFAAAALFLLGDAIARRRPAMADFLDPDIDLPHAGFWGGLFFLVAMLLAGLPPLSGFLGKFLILRATLAHSAQFWIWSAILLTALLTIITFVRAGSLLFFRSSPPAAPHQGAVAAYWEILSIGGLIALSLALTVGAAPALGFTQATAEQLLQPQTYIDAVLGDGR